ncbi:MAG: alpha/beta hydrolase domain-containing protein [Candidatus Binatia bacterium]
MSAACTAVGRRCFSIAGPALVGLLAVAIGCGDSNDSSNPMRGGSVSSPAVEGPVTGGNGTPFIASTTFDLAAVGYSEAEYFIAGAATAYTDVGPLGTDGNWTVTRSDTAAYKTRILVYRPLDPKKFNGTVVVEWLNVSGGLDSAADWTADHTELIRDGFAWVGVSAQRVGVEGGQALIPGLPAIPLKTTDPERYGSLVHPGDSFSYDMFSQAAQAIRRPAGSNPLGDLKISTVIATGDSQSAFRLVTYINAIHPLADIYDGFLVHSRGGNSFTIASLSETPQPAITVPGSAQIRNDLDVPVLIFETETDLTFLGYFSARQPDTDRFRLWEVAGTAHADTYTLGVGNTDLGNSPDAAKLVVTTSPVAAFPALTCRTPINSGPQHFVLNAAIAALNQWVRHGTPPPLAPRLDVVAGAAITIVRDANGNALGGIRTPQVDVPIAALSGQGQTGSILCALFGTTKPFDATTLASLYPDQSAYVSAFNAATDRAVGAGFILQPDAELMKAAAAS